MLFRPARRSTPTASRCREDIARDALLIRTCAAFFRTLHPWRHHDLILSPSASPLRNVAAPWVGKGVKELTKLAAARGDSLLPRMWLRPTHRGLWSR